MIKEEEVQDISRALTHMLFRNVPLAEKIQMLSLEYNKRLYPRESLIIFDEIQKYPKERQAIKYLAADGRYDESL